MAFGIIYFNYLPLLLLIPLAALFYFGFLFFIKGISKEELYLIKGLIKRK